MSMRYSVPQFIDVEDKIIGPISVRQFVTILVGAGLIFIAFKLLSFIIFLGVGTFIFALTGTVAFSKINGRPFHYFLLVIVQTLKRPRMKVWTKEDMYAPAGKDKKKKKGDEILPHPKISLSRSRLTQLGLMVDTGGAYQADEQDTQVFSNNQRR